MRKFYKSLTCMSLLLGACELLATTTATVTSDSDNGTNTSGTLSWAINQTNANGGGTISLDVASIRATADLPGITQSVTIQSTYSEGTTDIIFNESQGLTVVNNTTTINSNVTFGITETYGGFLLTQPGSGDTAILNVYGEINALNGIITNGGSLYATGTITSNPTFVQSAYVYGGTMSLSGNLSDEWFPGTLDGGTLILSGDNSNLTMEYFQLQSGTLQLGSPTCTGTIPFNLLGGSLEASEGVSVTLGATPALFNNTTLTADTGATLTIPTMNITTTNSALILTLNGSGVSSVGEFNFIPQQVCIEYNSHGICTEYGYQSSALTVNGSLGGTSGLTLSNAGAGAQLTCILTGINSLTGDIVVNGGCNLQVNSGSSLGTSSDSLTINSSASLTSSGTLSSSMFSTYAPVTLETGSSTSCSDPQFISDSITLAGTLSISPTADMTSTLAGGFKGITLTGGGTLEAFSYGVTLNGNSGQLVIGTSSTDSGTLSATGGADLIIGIPLTGAGTLNVNGGWAVTLTADNSNFTGDISISDVFLYVSASENLGSGSNIILGGSGNLVCTGSFTSSQTLDIPSPSTYIASWMYTPWVYVNANEIVTFTACGSFASDSVLNVGNPGAFVWFPSSCTTFFPNFNVYGTLIANYTLLSGTTSGSNVSIASETASLLIYETTGNTYYTNISGAGGVIIGGTGTVILAGSNTYTGATTIGSTFDGTGFTYTPKGVLQVDSSSVFTSGGVIGDGGILQVATSGLTFTSYLSMYAYGLEIEMNPNGATDFTTTWGGTIDGDGPLTLSGSGTFAMTAYNNGFFVGAIYVEDGVTLSA